jgi:carboxylesterase
MVIFSLREDYRNPLRLPDASIFLPGDENLCFLIHGLTGTPKELGAIANRLQQAGYSVAVPHLAYHNGPLSLLKRKKWQDFYQPLREEFLKYEKEYKNIFVAGLSFGALLAILLACEFPRKVKAIASFSITLFYDGWAAPKAKIWLPLGYYTYLQYWFYFKEDHPYGIKNEKLRSRIENYYKNAAWYDYSKAHLYGYPAIPVSCMSQNHFLAKKVISILPQVETPIQLFQAKDDDVTSPRNSQFVFARIASQDKELVFLEDSYHIITADQEREQVAEKTIAFFDKFRSHPKPIPETVSPSSSFHL